MKIVVDSEEIFLYYNQKKIIMTMNGRVIVLLIVTESWDWCKPVLLITMKIIHELRAEF